MCIIYCMRTPHTKCDGYLLTHTYVRYVKIRILHAICYAPVNSHIATCCAQTLKHIWRANL